MVSPSLNILVTGANGFVGKSLITALKKQGISFVGVGRQSVKSDSDSFFSVPDFCTADAWIEPLANCITVIHLAARVHVMKDKSINSLAEFRKVNVDGTLNLAQQAAKAGVKRFIFISSIKVNGEHAELGKPFKEIAAANPQDAYGISKHEAEQGLLLIAQQTGMEVVIIRPPLVYGVGVKANFASIMMAVRRGIPLPLGAIHNKRSFVYVGNLVSLIMCCIHHPAAANQIFLVSDGQDLSTTELLKKCAEALGLKSRLLPVPQKLVEAGATLLGRRALAQRLCGNLQVDITKTRELLGWEPPFSVSDGLKATALGMAELNRK